MLPTLMEAGYGGKDPGQQKAFTIDNRKEQALRRLKFQINEWDNLLEAAAEKD